MFNIFKKFSRKPKYFLCATIIIKNEAPYIEEWILFHKLMGVEKFFIYDNDSTDNILQILTPYIKSGLVKYKKWHGFRPQLKCYAHSIRHNRKKCDWMAFIDTDEFLVPTKCKTLHDAVKKLSQSYPNAAQIMCPWIMYGTNEHMKKPAGLVIANYTKHMPLLRRGHKSIIKLSAIKYMNSPHQAKLSKMDTIDQDGNVYSYDWFKTQWDSDIILSHKEIRCNHYWTKSEEEFKKRFENGCGNGPSSRTADELKRIEKDSIIEDSIMNKYAKILVEMLSK